MNATPEVPEHVEVPDCYTGRMKGIQGHYNSCYLDATLFCMFAFNDSLDFILQNQNLDELQNLISTHLKQGIVNPLRKYVIIKYLTSACMLQKFHSVIDSICLSVRLLYISIINLRYLLCSSNRVHLTLGLVLR